MRKSIMMLKISSGYSLIMMVLACLNLYIIDNTEAFAATFYVSPTGNDNNAGTQAAPWKTISKAQGFLGNLRGGDSVLFQRGGTWYDALDLSNVNGSAGFPVTFGNYGSGNLPIIDGGGTKSGNSVNGGRTWCMGGSNSKMSYITIDGFECRYTSNYGIAFFDVWAGSVGVIVQNSYIHDTGDGDYGYHNQLMWGDYRGNADGTKFLNNKVGNCYGHNCIQIHGDSGSPLIQGNECYGWSHNCIDVKYVRGAVVDSNVVHDGLGTQEYGEAFYNSNDGAYTWASDVTWTRNVVYGSVKSAAFQCQDSGGPVICHMYNNVVYSDVAGTYGGADSGDLSRVKFYVKNNIFDTPSPKTGGGFIEWDYNDHVQGGSIPSIAGSHNLTGVNPLYVNAASLNFRLQSGSPLIDKGTPVGLSYNGAAPDMGAYEFGGTGDTVPPSAPKNFRVQ
jgi:hypothetical protein